MQLVTLDEFIAEIETTFRNYADTNDIDRVSIKTWVINELRRFGKNICQMRETIVDVKSSRALLPETFKSLVFALKLTPQDDITEDNGVEKTLIIERQRIENPAEWSTATRDYFVNYCESKIVTEKVYAYNEKQTKYYRPHLLGLIKGTQSDTLDVNCLNLHPSIRDTRPDKISITNRTLNTNFGEGRVYIKYNALPSMDDEIAIPVITTGDIRKHVENEVSIKLAKDLILNQKQTQGLKDFLSICMQDRRLFSIEAKSEASWNGISDKLHKDIYLQNRIRQNKYNLPH